MESDEGCTAIGRSVPRLVSGDVIRSLKNSDEEGKDDRHQKQRKTRERTEQQKHLQAKLSQQVGEGWESNVRGREQERERVGGG